MNRIKPEKRRVFLACVVMAALLVVVGILRMNTVNQAKKQAERTSETLIQEYARGVKDLRLTVAVIEENRMSLYGYGEDGALFGSVESEVSASSGEEGGSPAPSLYDDYEIGSLTKVFVGELFGKYASEGRISLSDPASRYVDFGGKYDPTILELLTHTSAYEDYRTNSFIQMAKYRLNWNPYKGISSERVPVFMRRFSTGEAAPYAYSFSNFGYAVLGNIVESIEGRPFKNVMEDYIRTELELPDTAFMLEPELEKAWKWEADDAFLPAAGLTSDINDLARYVTLYFDGNATEGRLLAASEEKSAGGGASVGLGWGIRQDGVLGHGGETSRYSSQILMDREKQTAVIVLSNRTASHDISVSDIADLLYLESFGE